MFLKITSENAYCSWPRPASCAALGLRCLPWAESPRAVVFAHAEGEQLALYLERAAEEEIQLLTGNSRPDSPCSHSGKSTLARTKNPLVGEVVSIFETGLPTNKTKRQPAEWEKDIYKQYLS